MLIWYYKFYRKKIISIYIFCKIVRKSAKISENETPKNFMQYGFAFVNVVSYSDLNV